MTRAEFNKRLLQMQYLDTTMKSMEAFLNAWKKLNSVWSIDHSTDIDLNTYMVKMYPFEKSFDEMQIDVALWYGDACSKMVESKHDILKTLPHHNELEEEGIEYVTQQQIDDARAYRTAKVKASQFSFDDGEHYFNGYTFGELWNGWACPCFEHEQGMEIMRISNEMYANYDTSEKIFYNKEKDAFVYEMDNAEWDTYYAMTIAINGKDIKVYPIGAFGWCWRNKEDNEKA